ncbi:helix-turn-helix domain-containing protein [Tardiphaga robiniae]|uniref:Helix-turn-helix domain-containing protein n=1 Tax=Tardiphaga robiniae TaxID=943830 RepID=A0A7G6U3R4_9BRAD|nr:helix-turn-helix domain-containing protein [Tardiphaga robiniae]QND73646.1 helix-turn-helix domain-containing protein [Tardiphaga robiniae]
MQRGPSDTFIAHKAINLSDDMSATEKRVAATILDHFNRKTGQCDPSLDTIAKLLGVHRRTVIRAVNSLVKRGYLRKQRHGGHFHRNSYLPVWDRFRANEESWKERRQGARWINAPGTGLSPSRGQGCHPAGDADVTQTSSSNPLEETFGRASQDAAVHCETTVSKRLSEEDNRRAPHPIVRERFHVKSTNARDAARSAAEARWNRQLTQQFASAPDVFAGLIDALDVELQTATTDIELKRPGAGISFLLAELDRRLPLCCDGRGKGQGHSTVPSGDVADAGISDGEGSAVAADFQSLNTPKEGA